MITRLVPVPMYGGGTQLFFSWFLGPRMVSWNTENGFCLVSYTMSAFQFSLSAFILCSILSKGTNLFYHTVLFFSLEWAFVIIFCRFSCFCWKTSLLAFSVLPLFVFASYIRTRIKCVIYFISNVQCYLKLNTTVCFAYIA